MLYFQLLAVAVGLFILSDPFKAEDIEEPHALSHITTSLLEEPHIDQPHAIPLSTSPSPDEQDRKSEKNSANATLKKASTEAGY
ncbi:hypothetical protein IM40_07665 [Candidatus Paracaedimonas acanthamoebae]|nr:hypothetical protein IM40_07665 [Candidatus Paracaedimonas acanthamoebae]